MASWLLNGVGRRRFWAAPVRRSTARPIGRSTATPPHGQNLQKAALADSLLPSCTATVNGFFCVVIMCAFVYMCIQVSQNSLHSTNNSPNSSNNTQNKSTKPPNNANGSPNNSQHNSNNIPNNSQTKGTTPTTIGTTPDQPEQPPEQSKQFRGELNSSQNTTNKCQNKTQNNSQNNSKNALDNANNPEQVRHARTRLVRGANRRIDAGVLVSEGLETAQRNALYTAGLATRRSLRTKATFLVGSTASGGCLCEVLPN